MTVLSWDNIGERFYENGVSKGVLYTSDGTGVAWNGLISVEEKNSDSVDPLYYDGFKYGDLVTLGDFEGVLKAFTYPPEFLPYMGILEADPGFYMTSQVKTRFGLSWRTEVNNDLGQSVAYKIHVLWNALAIPQDKEYQTLSLDNEPLELEWNLSAIPEPVDNFRPTAYVVLDSRRINPLILEDIEAILYGNEESGPELPPLNGLLTFATRWARLIITDLGDGTWTAESSEDGVIEMLDAESFQITSDTAIFLDPDTFQISSDDEEEIP